MGSTGSGRFSDYSGSSSSKGSDGSSSGGGGASGGSSGVDRCKIAFSVTLEEVASCDYYATTHSLPVAGTELKIIMDKRLFAVDNAGTKVGALPTAYNYLASCLSDGHDYVGVVKHATVSPFQSVVADFAVA